MLCSAARPLVAIRDGSDDEDLSDAAVRDEPLGAIEQVVITVPHRCRLRSTGIAPGRFLGQAEAPHHAAACQEGDVALLLLGRPEVDNGRRAERGVGRDRQAVRGIDLGQLMDHDHVAREVEPRAPELLGPRNAQEAELRHLGDVRPREFGDGVEVCGHGRDLVTGERPHHVTHLQVLLVEVLRVVHVPRSCGRARRGPGGSQVCLRTRRVTGRSRTRHTRRRNPPAPHLRNIEAGPVGGNAAA